MEEYGKFITADAAARTIPDNACIWLVAGGGGINEPSLVLKAVEDRFMNTGDPRNLTVCHSAGIGDKCGGGVDRFAHEGMVRKVIGSHWTWSVRMQELAREEKIEAYVLPQGTMTQMAREIAAHRPGVVTKIGLGTFVDPRVEGGAMNAISKEKLTELIVLNEEEYLLYKSFPIDVCIIRASRADPKGNLSFEREGIVPECLAAAQAAKNSGGIVIAQVGRVTEEGGLDPLEIRVPGFLVDYVVVDPHQRQSVLTEYDPTFSAKWRNMAAPDGKAMDQDTDASGRVHAFPVLELNERKVIARRAAQEIRPGSIVNLGFGMPAGVASVIHEDGRDAQMKLSVEQGITGGIPAGGSDFGLVHFPEVMLEAPDQFDWYDGGGLDLAVLSFAEFDKQGNVNVSRFADRVNGVGGFINISQSAKKVIFVGTLTAGGLKEDFSDGTVRILQEGKIHKAVEKVRQISFSGEYAQKQGQTVLYVTERAVFGLTDEGVELLEIAPGADLERDVLANMDFHPILRGEPGRMKNELFI